MAQPTQERLISQLENPERTSGNVGQAGSGTEPHGGPNFQDHEDDHTHHVGMKTYYIIFTLLMVLLFITVGAWYIDQHLFSLGHFSTPIAMAIAVAKAAAIVLFFMHVKFSSRLVQIFACTGIAFVTIMFLLTFNDYSTRPWSPESDVYGVQSFNTGENGDSAVITRASSVGAAPNSQSTPADNMVGSASTAPGNATQTAIDGARDRHSSVQGVVNGGAQPPLPGGGTRGATSMRGAMSNPNSAVNQSGSSATSASTSSTQRGSSAIAASNSQSGRTGDQMTTGHNQAGAAGASGMNASQHDVATNGSTSNPGPHIGGAANNVYGSSVQSQGIEPRRVAPAPLQPSTSLNPTNPAAKSALAAQPATVKSAKPASATTAVRPSVAPATR